MTENSSTNVARFLGLVLIVVGLLWLGLSGLCAGAMIYSMITEGATHQEFIVWAMGVLIISGISGAMAFGIFVVGRGLWRSK